MLVTDTHALVWYTTQKTSRLSQKVTAVFEKANNAEAVISIRELAAYEKIDFQIIDRQVVIRLAYSLCTSHCFTVRSSYESDDFTIEEAYGDAPFTESDKIYHRFKTPDEVMAFLIKVCAEFAATYPQQNCPIRKKSWLERIFT